MNLTDFVSEQDGKVNVDWKGIEKVRRKSFLESDGWRSWDPEFEKLLDYLTAKNVLTYSNEDSWTLVSCGIDMSPKKPAPHSQLYFVRKKDAKAYRDRFYRKNLLRVKLRPARETI